MKLQKSSPAGRTPERKAIEELPIDYFYSKRPTYRNEIPIPDRKAAIAKVDGPCDRWLNLADDTAWAGTADEMEMRHWTVLVARIDRARDEFSKCVDIDPMVMGGVPVVKGTRMPVSVVLANIAENMTLADMAKDCDLDKHHLVLIFQCLATVFNRRLYEHYPARRMHGLQAIAEGLHPRGEDSDAAISEGHGWKVD